MPPKVALNPDVHSSNINIALYLFANCLTLDKKLFLPLNKIYQKVIGSYYSPFIVKKLLDELDLIISNEDLQFIEHNVNEIIKKLTIKRIVLIN